ncbi:hypothetical protein AQS8620_01790 [Aquimixticola soesokkakensis]|uniref:Cytoskeleton protein RodZ-like C-terminal domain-containing protein n=1 Tax=Aquimixticola soesokkakensis TaxID=1519096 RepID=A0A1Y5SMZ1_9RHOB|nr:hypothetical protein AQS8620_01790 [Aquimixticola soesokkakensis]
MEQEEARGFDAFEMRLGDAMRGERATLGKSLLDIQRELKIKATYIAAIENADPSVFETKGFIAGYVRSYARYLNLDPDWAYARFCAESGFSVQSGLTPVGVSSATRNKSVQGSGLGSGTGRADPFADPNAIFVPRGQSAFSRVGPGALGSTAVLLALVCAIGYGGWSVLQEIQRVKFAPVDQAPGVASAVDDLATDETVVAALGEAPSMTAPSAEAFDRLYRPQALDVPVLVPRDGPIAALDPATNGALADPFTATAALSDLIGPKMPNGTGDATLDALGQSMAMAALGGDAVQVTQGDVPELAIFAVRPSWIRVQSASGTVLFEKILEPGERYVLPATEEPPVLRSGNAGSVYFALNGAAYGPAGEGPSVVKNIALSVDNLSDSYQVADMSGDALLSEMFQVAMATQAIPEGDTAP